MRYLVEIVWASRSALNGSSDLYNLVFSRWDRRKDWSPWNCILLSKEETSAHLEVEDVHRVCHDNDIYSTYSTYVAQIQTNPKSAL